ncbi:MAG TPA: AMP-binding protein [Accumulibacter sp.]|uniref:acyl-CoA synthetase n=1 Tax=Accumulibacter sp. TaxID=2053492 RepID=UPI002C391C10|nr:AMP-binding protein [Accumulibacter sp.]HRF72858.1 AMP-binding protein [Accumulibacter sp.]
MANQAGSYAELCRNFRWQVPEHFNIGVDVCGRWAEDRSRFALYYEDESGFTSAHTFWDIQRAANRLSNVLAALGTLPGDRIAILLPQCPETAIAHVAIYQMGALAVPLSHLFGPDALEYRLGDAGAHLAIVDETTLPRVQEIRHRLPALRHILGVGAATGDGIKRWADVLELASTRYTPTLTAADDPAMIIYTSGTTGKPKGALMAHRTLLGNLSGYVCSHDSFPQARDMFWSPADWAWTGGLWDVLLPTWHFGMPLLAYKGRFDPGKAFALIEKYAIRNTFLFPTALKMMMKAVPEPKAKYDLDLRTIMSAGEPVGEAVFHWARERLGVTINEMFGQTEMNYVVGNCASRWPAKPGAMGRAYPGHRVAVVDDQGQVLPPGELGEVAVHRQCQDEDDPVIMLGYWQNPEATAAKFVGDGWGLTGDLAKVDGDGDLWYQGRADDVFNSGGYRIGPSEIENCLLKHPAVANCAVIGVPDHIRGTLVKAFVVLQAGVAGSPGLVDELQQQVSRHLAPYETPKAIEFVDALPMTTTGKVQRRLLRAREEGRLVNAGEPGQR